MSDLKTIRERHDLDLEIAERHYENMSVPLQNRPEPPQAWKDRGELLQLVDERDKRIEELNRLAVYLYNAGYHAGHADTVENNYTDVHSCDMHTYHDDIVAELIQEQSDGTNS